MDPLALPGWLPNIYSRIAKRSFGHKEDIWLDNVGYHLGYQCRPPAYADDIDGYSSCTRLQEPFASAATAQFQQKNTPLQQNVATAMNWHG